jgi:hypothetical protein
MLFMRPFTPANIIQFELAGTVEAAQHIMDDWSEAGIAKARLSIYLDFVFLVLYSATFSIGCKRAFSFTSQQVVKKISVMLSVLVWLAGGLDLIENMAMLVSLNRATTLTTQLAFYCAAIKFTIVLLAIAWMLASLVTRLIIKKVPVT